MKAPDQHMNMPAASYIAYLLKVDPDRRGTARLARALLLTPVTTYGRWIASGHARARTPRGAVRTADAHAPPEREVIPEHDTDA